MLPNLSQLRLNQDKFNRSVKTTHDQHTGCNVVPKSFCLHETTRQHNKTLALFRGTFWVKQVRCVTTLLEQILYFTQN